MDSSEKYGLNIKIADIPLRVVCRRRGERRFFEEYLTSDAPEFELEPDEAALENSRASLVEVNGEKAGESRFLIENSALHELIARAFAGRGALLVHGSCLSMDGEGYLFCAPSGTGKSTHARLWREAFKERVRMVDDDKPMLRAAGGRIVAYGTPWNGKHRLGGNFSVPLKAIVRLSRAETNGISPLSKAEAFELLLKSAYAPKTAELMRAVMALESEIVNRVSFYSLGCNMEPEAALTAFSGMNGER